MWLSAEERRKHRQDLCKQLQHSCTPWEECNTHVVLMVHIRHHKVQEEILRQRVQGSVRAIRAIHNTRVFLTETRVVADVVRKIIASKCIYPNSLDQSHHVHVQTCSIASSKCISKLGRLRPPSATTHSLHHNL